MEDRQQAIVFHHALSVKRALPQNVKSRFREKSYRDLQGKLRRKKKERGLVIMAHMAYHSFQERSLWMRLGNQAWFEMAYMPQFDEQLYESFQVTRDKFKFILNKIKGKITRQEPCAGS